MDTMQTGTATELWQRLVREATDRAQVELAETQESYLVFTLAGHMRDALIAGRVLALELVDGLWLDADAREERLRDVGDRCLLVAGLFPALARRRNVSAGYYADLGCFAYDTLAARRRDAMAALYAELAEGFRALVRVLRSIRHEPVFTVDASAGFDHGAQRPRLARERTVIVDMDAPRVH